jgi:two-component system cell cycle response regulator
VNAAVEESPLHRFWLWIAKPPDEILADAARDGELMVARLRVFITMFLAISPIVGLLLERDPTQNLIGLGVAFVFFTVACVLAYVVRRTPYSAQVSMISAIIDVSLVSLGLLTFWLVDHPLVTSNSRVLFECYFLAIGASALRYDARVTVVAGVAAILEHLGLSWLVAGTVSAKLLARDAPAYGEFSWTSQVSRALLLLSMTVVALELVRRAQRLRRLSTGDRLTGLFNRAYAEEYLTSEVLRTARSDSALVIGMLDVDHFKLFNDTYGHAAGDAALKHVASALRRQLRRSDLIARYGGEEFLIVLPGSGMTRGLEKLEEIRVNIALDEIPLPRGGRDKLTVSIGAAAWDEDGKTVGELLDVADARLYAAKAAGRNRVIGA